QPTPGRRDGRLPPRGSAASTATDARLPLADGSVLRRPPAGGFRLIRGTEPALTLRRRDHRLRVGLIARDVVDPVTLGVDVPLDRAVRIGGVLSRPACRTCSVRYRSVRSLGGRHVRLLSADGRPDACPCRPGLFLQGT